MVDDVVEHLCKTVIPDFHDVGGEGLKRRPYVPRPNNILFMFWSRKAVLELKSGNLAQAVLGGSRCASLINGSLVLQELYVLVHGLASDTEFDRHESYQPSIVGLNVFKNEGSDLLATRSNFAGHFEVRLTTLMGIIVNLYGTLCQPSAALPAYIASPATAQGA